MSLEMPLPNDSTFDQTPVKTETIWEKVNWKETTVWKKNGKENNFCNVEIVNGTNGKCIVVHWKSNMDLNTAKEYAEQELWDYMKYYRKIPSNAKIIMKGNSYETYGTTQSIWTGDKPNSYTTQVELLRRPIVESTTPIINNSTPAEPEEESDEDIEKRLEEELERNLNDTMESDEDSTNNENQDYNSVIEELQKAKKGLQGEGKSIFDRLKELQE